MFEFRRFRPSQRGLTHGIVDGTPRGECHGLSSALRPTTHPTRVLGVRFGFGCWAVSRFSFPLPCANFAQVSILGKSSLVAPLCAQSTPCATTRAQGWHRGYNPCNSEPWAQQWLLFWKQYSEQSKTKAKGQNKP